MIILIMPGAQDVRSRNTAANPVSRVTGQLINQSATSDEPEPRRQKSKCNA